MIRPHLHGYHCGLRIATTANPSTTNPDRHYHLYVTIIATAMSLAPISTATSSLPYNLSLPLSGVLPIPLSNLKSDHHCCHLTRRFSAIISAVFTTLTTIATFNSTYL